ncbi:MAG: hypothetical protein HWN66_14450 [Candidatus Helarchaeota archaeon]|nr:hypothetical protein [Candidatus Helarchaeota archaeon]
MSIYLQDWNASLHDKAELFNLVAQKISTALAKFFLPKVYVAIVDAVGTFHHIDTPAFDEHLYFIKNFIKENFPLLKIGDHSIPFGGINLAFFKISEKAIVILHTKKGRSGQLLSYKTVMFQWAKIIDELIGELNTEEEPAESQQGDRDTQSDFTPELPPQPVEKKKGRLKTIPLLVNPSIEKGKFPIEEVRVLNLCDGTYSVDEIVEETKLPRLNVNFIIRKYKKKKWLKIMRLF